MTFQITSVIRCTVFELLIEFMSRIETILSKGDDVEGKMSDKTTIHHSLSLTV